MNCRTACLSVQSGSCGKMPYSGSDCLLHNHSTNVQSNTDCTCCSATHYTSKHCDNPMPSDTHTHMLLCFQMLSFHVLWGLTICRHNDFYTVQTVYYYTNPSPKPITENFLHVFIFKNNNLVLFISCFPYWDQKMSTRTSISDNAIFVGIFCPHNV